MTTFLSHQRISQSTDLPQDAIGPFGPIASRGGSVPDFRRKPITACDFTGGKGGRTPCCPLCISPCILFVEYPLRINLDMTILTQIIDFLCIFVIAYTLSYNGGVGSLFVLVSVGISHSTDSLEKQLDSCVQLLLEGVHTKFSKETYSYL